MTARPTMATLAEAATIVDVWPPVLAVDPGSAETGITLRCGRDALRAVTYVAAEGTDTSHHGAMMEYARSVVDVARELTAACRDQINVAARERGVDPPQIRHAVETITLPGTARAKGRRVALAPTVLAGLPGTGVVLGHVTGVWPKTVLVPPRGGAGGGWEALNGSPAVLHGRRPQTWPHGGHDRSHQRSAWAIAGAGHVLSAPQPNRDQKALAAAVVQQVLRGGPEGWVSQASPADVVAATRDAVSAECAWTLAGDATVAALVGAAVHRATGDREQGQAAVEDAHKTIAHGYAMARATRAQREAVTEQDEEPS